MAAMARATGGRSWRCAIIVLATVFAPGVSSLSTHAVRRRAVLLGAAASIPASLKPAGANDDKKSLTSSLTTDRVIVRAVREQMLEPRDIRTCDELESVYKVDIKAADEVLKLNEGLSKLSAATKDTLYETKYTEPLSESYELGRIVERRIRERAQQINVRYVNECSDRFDRY